MDLLEQTKKLCRLYGVKPSRSKGQNFLVDENVYDKVVSAADLHKDDVVLEVGPGFGFLTAKLAQQVKKVIAVELDDKLVKALGTGLKMQGVGNVEVRNEDILEVRSEKLEVRNYKVVANLPYNITSHFLRKFLENDNLRPVEMVLMLQKEVAQRICAQPGEMSLLAVSVQFYAEPKIVDYVPKSAFWPEPAVDSAILKLEVRSKKYGVEERDFFRLAKIGFSARRKMLKNNLAAGYKIVPSEAEKMIIMAGLREKARAQDLSVKDWLKLFGCFKSIMV